MKTHIQISYKKGKSEGRRCVQGLKEISVNGSEQLFYWCSGTLIFLECSFMLNVTPVKNAFLSYTWLSKCFFSDVSFLQPEYIFILQAIW